MTCGDFDDHTVPHATDVEFERESFQHNGVQCSSWAKHHSTIASNPKELLHGLASPTRSEQSVTHLVLDVHGAASIQQQSRDFDVAKLGCKMQWGAVGLPDIHSSRRGHIVHQRSR
jgi:hypothetical protein